MSLKARLQADVVVHMRAIAATDISEEQRSAHKVGLQTVRNVLGEIETREKSGKAPVVLDDAQLTSLLQKEAAKRRDTAAIYAQAGEQDRAGREVAEAQVIEAYLPRPLTREEVEAIVDQAITAISDHGNTELTIRQMGHVMKPVTAVVAGRFDGKAVSEIVRARLA